MGGRYSTDRLRQVAEAGPLIAANPWCDLRVFIGAADLDDGCHPNAAGHQKLCDRVAEFMPD